MGKILESIQIKEKKSLPLYIGGKWRESSDKKTFSIVSPINQRIVREAAKASTEDAFEAVGAAYFSREAIGVMPSYDRAQILKKTADLLKENQEEFLSLITEEAGKTIEDASSEVKASIERLMFGVEEAHTLSGTSLRGDTVSGPTKKLGMVLRQPLGVILAITPFNYPLYITVSKIAPAIASGNSVIVKPASADPTPVLLLAKLFEEAGLPEGVLQVVTGGGALIGDILVTHPKVNMISFTGNTNTGHHIAEKAVFAKLHLELGGKCPGIVLDPCDLDLAVKECVKGSFKYSGQRCDAISRVLVVEKHYDKFIEKAVIEAEKWKMGDPTLESVKVGPLISEEAIKKVTELVGDAVTSGAKVHLGGGPVRGLYFAPTVLSDVTVKMKIAWEETFGPVLSIIKVKDYREAIEIANQSEFGLDASVFTTDVNLALDASLRLETGTVQINGVPAHGLGNFPYGGDESSGLGREGLFVSAEEMTKLHTVVFNPQK